MYVCMYVHALYLRYSRGHTESLAGGRGVGLVRRLGVHRVRPHLRSHGRRRKGRGGREKRGRGRRRGGREDVCFVSPIERRGHEGVLGGGGGEQDSPASSRTAIEPPWGQREDHREGYPLEVEVEVAVALGPGDVVLAEEELRIVEEGACLGHDALGKEGGRGGGGVVGMYICTCTFCMYLMYVHTGLTVI